MSVSELRKESNWGITVTAVLSYPIERLLQKGTDLLTAAILFYFLTLIIVNNNNRNIIIGILIIVKSKEALVLVKILMINVDIHASMLVIIV